MDATCRCPVGTSTDKCVLPVTFLLTQKYWAQSQGSLRRRLILGLLKPSKTRNGSHRHRRRNKGILRSGPQRKEKRTQHWFGSRATDREVRRQQNAKAGHSLGRAWPNQENKHKIQSRPARNTAKDRKAKPRQKEKLKENRKEKEAKQEVKEVTQ
ncbi:hypothetical protein NDU88_003418 [Pleurodeles waltl]|uniref:Uncharacterized protein n=1 Tax=Pleurodeles waltl TaxID=8319 RepID=A0AAV7T6E1_PLEWA|nr:hypothetical protein NDU88_003418 [Pleurodeles waltl]